MGIATINPATGETVKTFTALTDAEIENALALADRAFRDYRRVSFDTRSQWMQNAANLLEENAETYAKIMTLEMGKPITAAIAEVKKSAAVCRFYAENAAQFLADVPAESDASNSFIAYEPLGAILAVMPWNFPFWQVFRFAAPALMAGNVGLLKHASNVPQCALAIGEIFQKAGFPEGVFQTLLVGSNKVAQIITDDRVKAGTLTGSEPAGASLASLAGQNIKKTVLELGGSDPFIVLETADINAAVEAAVTARMLNNGQSCIAAKRFILISSIADEFEIRMAEKFAALKIGDPMLPDTEVGPLATPDILTELHQQVQICIEAGAKVLTGGQLLEQPGNFYPPTILTQIPEGTPAYSE